MKTEDNISITYLGQTISFGKLTPELKVKTFCFPRSEVSFFWAFGVKYSGDFVNEDCPLRKIIKRRLYQPLRLTSPDSRLKCFHIKEI